MDAVGTLANDSAYLVQADFPAVVGFTRAARRQARALNGEDDRLEMRLIVDGEWTVYENVPSAHPEEREARTLEIAASSSRTVKCVALPFGFKS